ncbi:unnamed protein product [Ranitomeya imitator]|uniref:Uncharacterized protein n=1 Tax=Ranitomeya imitator TaxID=111125 RepID=A0ABN9KT89_9NEOB|nr:unnamed protein product [Ranitomeya imitator]
MANSVEGSSREAWDVFLEQITTMPAQQAAWCEITCGSNNKKDQTFLYSSSSSSEEGPAARNPRTAINPIWIATTENYQPVIPDFIRSLGIQFDVTGLTETDFFKFFFSKETKMDPKMDPLSLPKPLNGQMLRKGESRARCSDNMLVVKHNDKLHVLILTTIHCENSLFVTKYQSQIVSWITISNTGTFLQFQEEVIKALMFGTPEGECPSTPETDSARVVLSQSIFYRRVSPNSEERKITKTAGGTLASSMRENLASIPGTATGTRDRSVPFFCYTKETTSVTKHPEQYLNNKDYVAIEDLPKTLANADLSVEYLCSDPCTVYVDVVASSEFRTGIVVIKKRWRNEGNLHQLQRRTGLGRAQSGKEVRHSETFFYAAAKAYRVLDIHPPHQRPYKDPPICVSWISGLLRRLKEKAILVCPVESDVVTILPFPLASNGEHSGLIKTFEPFTNGDLEKRRRQHTSVSTVQSTRSQGRQSPAGLEANPESPYPGYIRGLSTAFQNAVDKPLMLVDLAHLRFWG